MIKIKGINNKGYMLVEIILASALAFGLTYFIMDLTIKLKNKNDDLLVETLVSTDKSIISNGIVKYIKLNEDTFECDSLKNDDKNIYFKNAEDSSETFIAKVNDYVILSSITCSKDANQIHVVVPLEVKQIKDKNFDVDIYYKLS